MLVEFWNHILALSESNVVGPSAHPMALVAYLSGLSGCLLVLTKAAVLVLRGPRGLRNTLRFFGGLLGAALVIYEVAAYPVPRSPLTDQQSLFYGLGFASMGLLLLYIGLWIPPSLRPEPRPKEFV